MITIINSLILTIGSLLFVPSTFCSIALQNKSIGDKAIITHAMGEIDGHFYTNSLEAFEYSYHHRKNRVFEVDLELTKEEVLVARHDWRLIYAEQLEQTPETTIDNEPWTYEYFMNQNINKKYTPLDINRVIELLKKHTDVYIVTDTKHFDPMMIEKQFSKIVQAANYDEAILARIIPQIYTEEMLTIINQIYHFNKVIYTLYHAPNNDEQVVKFVQDNVHQITAVTMPTSRINENFLDNLHDLNINVYTHPIWSMEEALHYHELGVDGFYSATISRKELKRVNID
ncbi:phosphatidylinositol-specific phospholipase C/glycerophosphodiester phosphodiesterase family protein [Bacillus sp. 1P02SD]|uniref:phosphatidylinositol-specific phospholipase C/glycerophosphodiester phosphodiesterase family protein n=1 Tax=Bacillus sp. 1P02SD TaxID=3132264 RepID=UPI0039A05B75